MNKSIIQSFQYDKAHQTVYRDHYIMGKTREFHRSRAFIVKQSSSEYIYHTPISMFEASDPLHIHFWHGPELNQLNHQSTEHKQQHNRTSYPNKPVIETPPSTSTSQKWQHYSRLTNHRDSISASSSNSSSPNTSSKTSPFPPPTIPKSPISTSAPHVP